MAMEQTLLEVKELKKYFPIRKGLFSKKTGWVKAVNGVSFSLKKGETLGLVGESGCGKSTVGKTLLQLIHPTGGKAIFDGRVLFDVESNVQLRESEFLGLRKEMQMIFQDPYACLDPRMNIYQIVTEGLKKHNNYSKSELWDKAGELIEKCGLGKENLLKYPHQFSGGQRQRIGIARALSLEPKFIVCDEPTAALDVSIQSQILNLMTDLKKEYGLSYLFISHDLHIVRHFCNRVCVMYLGVILEEGSAASLFDQPRHPYTKALLSCASVFSESRRESKIFLKGELPSPSNLPDGCLFQTRCWKVQDMCKAQRPMLKFIGKDQWVACHFAD